MSAIQRKIGGNSASLVISLGAAYSKPISLNVATTDGTATAGKDYKAINTVVTFAAGEISKTVKLEIMDDNDKEGLENFTVSVSEEADLQPLRAIVNIQDND